MSDGSLWKRVYHFDVDPAVIRRAVGFSVAWFVAWTGFLLYSGNELVPTLIQGVAFAVALGVIAYFTERHSRRK